MRPIARYLDDLIEQGTVKNDSETARKLSISRATVSKWRSGERTPEDDEAVKLANLLGREAGELLAQCGAARARTPETRRAWERIAARMASYGITVCALIITIGQSEEARAYSKNDDLQRLPVFRRKKEEMIQKLKRLLRQYDRVHTKMTHECFAA